MDLDEVSTYAAAAAKNCPLELWKKNPDAFDWLEKERRKLNCCKILDPLKMQRSLYFTAVFSKEAQSKEQKVQKSKHLT